MSTVTTTRSTRLEAPSLLHHRITTAAPSPLDREVRRDLLHDQLLQRLTHGRGEYQLEDWFTTPATRGDLDHRHAVFRDLARPELRDALAQFAGAVHHVRRMLDTGARSHYEIERQRWFLEAALRYTTAMHAFTELLDEAVPSSDALRRVSDWLTDYVEEPRFGDLASEAQAVADQLGRVRYRVRVHGDQIQVRPVDPDEPDYAAEVLETFSRFRQGAGRSFLKQIQEPGSLDHVEAAVAGFVARLHPDAFEALRAFFEHHQPLVPEAVKRLEREAQFYLAYLEIADALASRGLPCSLPVLADDGRVEVEGGFDLVLALEAGERPTVLNDCVLVSDERLLVVTGPNQGGKTTFARMLGQLHLLATLGVPVPARRARLPLLDEVLTIFERGENLADQRGHLQDDLHRARDLLDRAGPASLVLLNEVFASTTLDDSLFLARDFLHRLGATGARCVCVTFLDELAALTPTTVSMVAGVDPDDPTRRTYRVERRPADGLAYAHALAEQHGLTRAALARRLPR